MKKLICLALFVPAFAFAQGIPVKDGTTSQLASVNTAGALMTNEGPSKRVTYIASVSGATTTATWNIACESSASLGFKVSQFCVTIPPGATAAGAGVTVALRRSTAAGSGGTALTAEGTGATAVSRMDPASGTFPGTCRGLASTLGTAGATIDQFQVPQLTLAAGTPVTFCKNYGMNGDQLPTVQAGTANGIYITVSAAGAGSLAVGAATMVLVTEN